MATVIRGPAWSKQGLQLADSRYPLRVERHVSRLVSALVPGVITTTPHARAYSLHTLVWVEAARRGLGEDEATDLVRRCEVVLAGATILHEGQHAFPLGQPHGGDVIRKAMRDDGVLRVDELATQNRYSQNRRGFAGVYLGAEMVLGMVRSGRPPVPGPRVDELPLRDAIGDVLELAGRDSIALDELSAHPSLCLCAARDAADGDWIRRVFLRPVETEGVDEAADLARRQTAQILGWVIDAGAPTGNSGAVAEAFRRMIAFGSFIDEDGVLSAIESAHVWRGAILRNYSVGAWRRIWSWLVDQLDDPLTALELAERFAGALPNIRVGDLLDGLSAPIANGALEPVEEDLRAGQPGPDPLKELQLLALGAERISELDGRGLQAFVGSERADDLGPSWVAAQLHARSAEHLRDFARSLAKLLVDRAFRVALSKMVMQPSGDMWMPSRIRDRAGLLSRLSREGWADVGIRVDTLSSVLLGCGVFDVDDGRWIVTDVGEVLLA